jgi:multidrug efflux pump subunit AcrA (membrane-fusion protein)
MKRFVRGRLMLAAAAFVVLAGAGGFVYTRVASGADAQYRTAAATLGTVIQTVSLSGNLTPTEETNLDFGSSGKVTAVDVQPGGTVTQGEILASIDATQLQAQLAQAQATLASAKAKLSLDEDGSAITSDQATVGNAETSLSDTRARNNLTVSQDEASIASAEGQSSYSSKQCPPPSSLSPQQQPTAQQACDKLQSDELGNQESLDQAEAQLTSAENSLSTAEAQQPAQVEEDQAAVQSDQVGVQQAEEAVSGATLTAPSAGEVAEVNITVGEEVTGSSSSGSGAGSSASSGSGSGSSSYAVVLIAPGQFEVTGSVSDAQVNEIAIGQSAYVTPAGTTQTYTGKVTEVSPVATISSGVATFTVTVTITGSHNELKDGMSASVSVTVNQVVGVLTVPTSAVHHSGGSSTVQVLENGQPVSVPVTVGASDARVTQIVSGLSAGEQVVIAQVTANIPSSGSGGNFRGLGGLGGGRAPAGGAGAPVVIQGG